MQHAGAVLRGLRPGRARTLGGVLFRKELLISAAAVLVLVIVGGVIALSSSGSGPLKSVGYASTGQTPAAATLTGRTVNQPIYLADIALTNPGTQAAKLLSLAIVGSEPHLRIGAAFVTGPVTGQKRPVPPFASDAAKAGRLQGLAGYSFRPTSGGQVLQLGLPIKLRRPGVIRIAGYELLYSVGGKSYTMVLRANDVICTTGVACPH
jgi:hypothetical protein